MRLRESFGEPWRQHPRQVVGPRHRTGARATRHAAEAKGVCPAASRAGRASCGDSSAQTVLRRAAQTLGFARQRASADPSAVVARLQVGQSLRLLPPDSAPAFCPSSTPPSLAARVPRGGLRKARSLARARCRRRRHRKRAKTASPGSRVACASSSTGCWARE